MLIDFPFPDTGDGPGMLAELARFLDAGSPPIVFTLGSSGMLAADTFYETSARLPGGWAGGPCSWSARPRRTGSGRPSAYTMNTAEKLFVRSIQS